ncbi:hypothetical protein EVAR_30496_1 [Eumeta japonica]|uniref:Uncharacterized protein n=1 Tax=Eumeta variegata TaxID=151549 RepID=A0A4C1VZC3_EUMVA|nr:hypothetical protein EVAR_30496_1 [Eumeta japonica]
MNECGASGCRVPFGCCDLRCSTRVLFDMTSSGAGEDAVLKLGQFHSQTGWSGGGRRGAGAGRARSMLWGSGGDNEVSTSTR